MGVVTLCCMACEKTALFLEKVWMTPQPQHTACSFMVSVDVKHQAFTFLVTSQSALSLILKFCLDTTRLSCRCYALGHEAKMPATLQDFCAKHYLWYSGWNFLGDQQACRCLKIVTVIVLKLVGRKSALYTYCIYCWKDMYNIHFSHWK